MNKITTVYRLLKVKKLLSKSDEHLIPTIY